MTPPRRTGRATHPISASPHTEAMLRLLAGGCCLIGLLALGACGPKAASCADPGPAPIVDEASVTYNKIDTRDSIFRFLVASKAYQTCMKSAIKTHTDSFLGRY